jgi:hypothetical protein
MSHPTEQSIRKACEEAGVVYQPPERRGWTVVTERAILALARRIEAEAVPVAWLYEGSLREHLARDRLPVRFADIYHTETPLYAPPPKEPTT